MCLIDWHSQKCVPKMLFCGHSFCESCLADLFKPTRNGSPGTLQCPTCMVSHTFKRKEELKNLIRNFTLISLAEGGQNKAPIPQS